MQFFLKKLQGRKIKISRPRFAGITNTPPIGGVDKTQGFKGQFTKAARKPTFVAVIDRALLMKSANTPADAALNQ
jgi:hypothetical protein